MVSEVSDIQSFKLKKSGYGSQASTRFSDSALRPWPPTYRDSSRSNSNYMSAPPKFNGNYNKNIYNYDGPKQMLYQKEKPTFPSGHHPSSNSTRSNSKPAKDYYYLQNGHSNGSGRAISNSGYDQNRLIMDKMMKKESSPKYRPPQMQPSNSSCPCTRSKSMEDVRAEVVHWTGDRDKYYKFKNERDVPKLNQRSNRRSMDNLLDEDYHFSKRFQVGFKCVNLFNYKLCVCTWGKHSVFF